MSLFSNSNANRRIERGGPRRSQSLLEVTSRPDKERKVLVRKRVFVCLKGILTAALVGVVVFGGRTAVQRLVWENPSYAISDIRFSTDGMLTRAQVLEALELWEGRNIFTVDIAKLRNSLDSLPQVDRAEVRRILPDRLDIRIVERQPVAWVAESASVDVSQGGRAFLVDARGYVMRTRKILPEYLALPLIVGVNMEDVAPGQRLPSPESNTAVELLRLSTDDLRWQPRVVDVSKGYCLVVTDQRRAKVTFGFDGIETQLNRLKQVLDTVEPMQRELQTVNLMLERNIPVTFVPPPVVAAPEQKGKSKVAAKGGAPASAPVSTAVTAEQISKAQMASPLLQLMAKRESAPSAPSPASLKENELAREKEVNREPVRESVREHSREPVREAVQRPKVAKAPEPESKPEPKAKMVKAPEPEPEPERPVLKPARKKTEVPAEVPPRALPVEKSQPVKSVSPPQPPPQNAPGTLTPNEKLRKLFQPHG